MWGILRRCGRMCETGTLGDWEGGVYEVDVKIWEGGVMAKDTIGNSADGV